MTESVLDELARTLAARRGGDPSASYTAALMAEGDEKILKKIGEEATEVVLAGAGSDDRAVVHEVADLWFHTLVLLARRGLGPEDVLAELGRRTGVSGHAEKAARTRS
jgi:phosphoribosyl-ATP pyrophosphohydrolase